MCKNLKTKRVTDEAKIIGQNLYDLRKSSGLTQSKLAKFLDVTFQQIQKYECGANRLPIEKLYQLKHYYDVPYDAFFEGLSVKTRI